MAGTPLRQKTMRLATSGAMSTLQSHPRQKIPSKRPSHGGRTVYFPRLEWLVHRYGGLPGHGS